MSDKTKYPQTKTVCQLDDNHFFIGTTEADLSPLDLDTGVYLMPAGSIDTTPPKNRKGLVAKWMGDNWQYIPDHRGEIVYSTIDQTELTISELGALPDGYTTIKPTNTNAEWNGEAWEVSAELQAVKKAEEIAMVRERINTLRDSKSAGGVYVEQLGKWFDSDSKAQAKLLGLKATMDLAGEMTVDWTCADNTDFEGFGKAHLTAVIATILQAENHNHTIARQHKAALEQAENPLEYDYSAGWTQTYEEHKKEHKNAKTI